MKMMTYHPGLARFTRAAQKNSTTQNAAPFQASNLIKVAYEITRDGAPMLLTGGMITALLAMATSIGLGFRGSL